MQSLARFQLSFALAQALCQLLLQGTKLAELGTDAGEFRSQRRLKFPLDCRPGSTRNLVEFRSQDEIAFRQAVDLVRPDLYSDFAPRQVEIRMMPLLLGNGPGFVYEIERLLEIREGVSFLQMVLVDDVPTGNLPL